MKELEKEEHKAAVQRTRRKKEVQKYQLAQVKRKRELAAEQLLGKAFAAWLKYCTKVSYHFNSEQQDDCEENMLVRAEQQDNEKLKQQRIEEQNNYMRECFFAHLAGKKAIAEQSKRKDAEEEREREIFNQHKERMQIIQKQKLKVSYSLRRRTKILNKIFRKNKMLRLAYKIDSLRNLVLSSMQFFVRRRNDPRKPSRPRKPK